MRRMLAVLVLLLSAPGVAGANTITFEDQAATAPGPGGHGTVINTQYAGQGVTFNNVEAYNYSTGSSAIPNFAHSGVVAVEDCVAAEFCTAPITGTLTQAQQHVEAWVGADFAHPTAIAVRLTAFNAGGTVVGMANGSLAPTGTPAPIAMHLTIDTATSTIKRIEVNSPGGGFMNGIAVDDVEFGVPTPPGTTPTPVPTPACPAMGRPGVEVTQPGGQLTVTNNSFVLAGKVMANGAPITAASVTANARTASVFPTLIGGAGGAFGPIHFNGILSPGTNAVTVNATNCAGSTVSKAVEIKLSPIPDGAAFVQLAPIEVTQGVQNPAGSVPLVGTAGFGGKRTYARIPLAVTGTTDSIRDVTATLNATRADGTHLPGPQIITSTNAIEVVPGATYAELRTRLEGTLNFELPPEWTTQGQLHLQIDHISVEGEQTLVPCTGCDNIDADGPHPVGPSLVDFRKSPPLRVILVSVPIHDGAFDWAPRQLDLDMAASWLRRAYPSADIQILQDAIPAVSDVSRCDDVNAVLRTWAAPFWSSPTKIYGMYGEPFGAIIAGCSDIGGHIGSGPAGAPRHKDPTNPADTGFADWDEDQSYGDAYAGHEIGHQFDRLHSGCSQPGFDMHADDQTFPYANGQIGDFPHDNVGFDGGDSTFSVPTQLYYWNGAHPAHDIMSYCDDQWPSAYTYTSIMKNMCHPGFGPFFCTGAPIVSRAAARTAKLRPLVVNGSLARKTGAVTLQPLSVMHGPGLSPRPQHSRFAIRLQGRHGRRLARYPFTPHPVSDQTGLRVDTISEVVGFVRDTRRIQITRGHRVLKTVRVSAHAPRVNLTATAPDEPITWRAHDADGNRLHFALLYAADGKHFTTIAAGLRKRSYTVDPATLGGGLQARLKVVATDGVLTGAALSAPMSVPFKPSRVSIASPADGASYASSVPVPLIGVVNDMQGTDTVTWSSSIQGALGQGASITPTLLPGTHTITMTATNGGGQASTAQITVTVAAPLPSFDATSGR